MSAARGSHVHRLRTVASVIFGFDAKFFTSDFDCSKVTEFQVLLRVKDMPKGKWYPMLPPILFLDGGSANPGQLFLNPALIKVSVYFNIKFLFCRLSHV